MEKYPIDIKDECVYWGRIRKEYYWGRIAGGIRLLCGNLNSKEYQFGFKIKKWNNGQMNSGPCGYKLKRAKRGRV